MTDKPSPWWEQIGRPEYGGEITLRLNRDIANFDPYFFEMLPNVNSAWLERLFADDWTLDPQIYRYNTHFRPGEFVRGHLAESWEFPAPDTLVVHLHRGIRWQAVFPANGREFTADDVVFHYHRLYGLGSGFTQPSPYHAAVSAFKNLISVAAVDKFTVIFKWRTPNPEFILETMQAPVASLCLENPEAVRQWGDVCNWRHAVGTGPFILQDFELGKSLTLVRNPDYWGRDERYPQNRLPYADRFKILIIPDEGNAVAALRDGKIDALDQVSIARAEALQKSNPEILQIMTPSPSTPSLDPRNDLPPFNDIRVRKALQLAIDLPTIARTYYGGKAGANPSTLTSRDVRGWGFPYEDWPQDLKDEYTYNPELSRQLLTAAGYPKGFSTHIVVESTVDIKLLDIVKSYFAAVGVEMEIRPLDTASFVNYVLTSHRNDQLVQRSASSLGLATEPIRQLERLRTGAVPNYLMVSDTVFDSFLPRAMAAGSIDEIKKIVRDANEYVARQHFAISLVQPMQYSLYQPWLKGYSGQFFAVSAASGGPPLYFFYPARFWVDRKLKKQMVH
jgi:peptide/nickel transport system substrate-binding protein